MRILVIEDDPTVGQYVKRGLEEHRWAVDLMTDGEEGERRASSEAYDLIVLDMRLPGKSGLDVLRSLRAKGFERPVLVLTAQDAVDAKVSTLRAGADDYVTKPFAFEEMLALAEALARRCLVGGSRSPTASRSSATSSSLPARCTSRTTRAAFNCGNSAASPSTRATARSFSFAPQRAKGARSQKCARAVRSATGSACSLP